MASTQPRLDRKRLTFCFHEYIGYGSYVITYKRAFCSPERLEKYKSVGDLHFIIPGWPEITYPDGTSYFEVNKETS